MVQTEVPIPALQTSEIPVPNLIEKVETKNLEDENGLAAIALPPGLQWLEKSTPFGDHLRPMVDRLRAAKTEVVIVLEQSTLRQTDLRNQIAALKDRLDKEEYLGEQQREYLRQLDEVIAACALVAEQSVGIEQILYTPAKKHIKANSTGEKRKYRDRQVDERSTCHRADIEKIFTDSPDRKWSNQEIIDDLPLAKQAHAKMYIYAVLSTMAKEGAIRRIAPGVYCAANG
jgi:hypothetical protein